jgi:hypothetical protein
MASKSVAVKAKEPAKEKQTAYTIACLPSERAAWVAAAKKLDRPLSWWVRRVCNAAVAADLAREGETNVALSR